ncbi:MAG: hypothetical protein K2Y37_13795 [Pirellulales bacterium]|nr:hypothetical protein [Pirellulales bacterium]
MTFDEWLASIPIHQTPKGARLNLRLYVYPDGHGNFCVEDAEGRVVSGDQPVNDPDEAQRVLDKLWFRAMAIRRAEPPTSGGKTLAQQLAEVVGTVPELPSDMAENHDHYLHGAPKR